MDPEVLENGENGENEEVTEDLTSEELAELEDLDKEISAVEKQETEDSEDIEDLKSSDEATGEPADIKSLQARLSEMESSNQGLVQALSAQRGLRQELQNQLASIKSAIATARTQNTAPTQVSAATAAKAEKQGIPVDFDDDGNMFIDPKYLTPTDTPEIKALKNDLNRVKMTLAQQKAETAELEGLNAILAEHESYPETYREVTQAWEYMRDTLFENYLAQTNVQPPTTPDGAIDMIMSTPELISAFQEQFPTVDLESTLEAHLLATPRYLRKALRTTAAAKGSNYTQLDLSRPTSLANANSAGNNSPDSLLSRVADMSVEDYENLDERTLAKIDQLMSKM